MYECIRGVVSQAIESEFVALLTDGPQTVFTAIDVVTSLNGAKLGQKYGLRLPDAMQAAIAMDTGCQAILTNDKEFRKLPMIKSFVLDELMQNP